MYIKLPPSHEATLELLHSILGVANFIVGDHYKATMLALSVPVSKKHESYKKKKKKINHFPRSYMLRIGPKGSNRPLSSSSSTFELMLRTKRVGDGNSP